MGKQRGLRGDFPIQPRSLSWLKGRVLYRLLIEICVLRPNLKRPISLIAARNLQRPGGDIS